MAKPSLLFFGSFLEYSATVLKQLVDSQLFEIRGVVTTPPMPAGRKQELKKTPVHDWAERHSLPVFTPEVLSPEALADLPSVELLVTAGYGKLLPATWLAFPKLAALNLHFSLLPKYRGANPAEWALLLNEKDTGVTVIEMSPEFDTGTMVAQAGIPIQANDTRETIYTKLYDLGGKILPEVLKQYYDFKTTTHLPDSNNTNQLASTEVTYFWPPQPQPESSTPYAKRLIKDDAFVAWPAFIETMNGKTLTTTHLSPQLQKITTLLPPPLTANFLERATRALAGFPGLWTIVKTTKGDKRLKILHTSISNSKLVLEKVQLEGKQPSTWNEIKNLVKS